MGGQLLVRMLASACKYGVEYVRYGLLRRPQCMC